MEEVRQQKKEEKRGKSFTRPNKGGLKTEQGEWKLVDRISIKKNKMGSNTWETVKFKFPYK